MNIIKTIHRTKRTKNNKRYDHRAIAILVWAKLSTRSTRRLHAALGGIDTRLDTLLDNHKSPLRSILTLTRYAQVFQCLYKYPSLYDILVNIILLDNDEESRIDAYNTALNVVKDLQLPLDGTDPRWISNSIGISQSIVSNTAGLPEYNVYNIDDKYYDVFMKKKNKIILYRKEKSCEPFS